jgi:hypothetical protein
MNACCPHCHQPIGAVGAERLGVRLTPRRHENHSQPPPIVEALNMRPTLSEQDIARAIIEHLAWRGHPNAFLFHVPNGGYRRPTEAAILKAIGTVAGVPDLIALHRGKFYALELKTERGRLTDVQRVAHERLKRAGAKEVAVAFGLDEALAKLEEWKILRGRVS